MKGALWLMACERWCQGATHHSVTNSVKSSRVMSSAADAMRSMREYIHCAGQRLCLKQAVITRWDLDLHCVKTLPEKSDVHGCVKSLPGKGGAQGSRHGRTKVEILQDIADLIYRLRWWAYIQTVLPAKYYWLNVNAHVTASTHAGAKRNRFFFRSIKALVTRLLACPVAGLAPGSVGLCVFFVLFSAEAQILGELVASHFYVFLMRV